MDGNMMSGIGTIVGAGMGHGTTRHDKQSKQEEPKTNLQTTKKIK